MRAFKIFALLFATLALVAAGCTTRPAPQATPTATSLATPTATPTPAAPPTHLRVWLPPSLAPDASPHAADLLNTRLQAFAAAHNITIEVRVKPLNGPAAMLTTLNATRTVAPDAVPDIVLMPRTLLEAAAVKGLAFPLPEAAFTTPLSADDWFPYAQHLATLQGVTYGVPFAGDAFGLVYHPKAFPEPPKTWEAWLQAPQAWVLPLGDPQAYALLALYRAAGGAWEDKTGRPSLDKDTLAAVLTLLQEAQSKHLLSNALLEITDDHMLWARYQGEAQALLLTRISHLLPGPDPRRMAPIPAGENGKPVAFSDGLLWALTTPDPNRQTLAVALLADLGTPDFVAQWTEAAGYLPPRQSALEKWENPEHRALVKGILPVLQPAPPPEVLTVLGPLVHQAAAQVLTGKQSPASAAQWAVSTLNGQGGG
ncbi:MAG TPA: extracellular solute-binding protein [Chloroflexi bacterium]|nr:extracellular solute-binding protein [Chloroflexota bacterium]